MVKRAHTVAAHNIALARPGRSVRDAETMRRKEAGANMLFNR